MTESRPKFDTYIITNDDLLSRLYKYVEKCQSEFVFIDAETDSKIEKTANLYGFSICFTTKKAFYIPWRTQEGDMFWSEEKQEEIKKWIINVCKKKKLINHNILYDILVFENNLNIYLTDYIYSDTILLKHAIDEEKPHGLKETAVKYLGSWADEAQQDLKDEVLEAGGRWNKNEKDMYLATTKTLGYYACVDVILTALLFFKFEEQLIKEELYDLFYEETMPLYKLVTINMKRKGFPVNVQHFKTLKKEITKDIEQIRKDIFDQVSDYIKEFEDILLDKDVPVKINTQGNLAKVYADFAGIPVPITEKGKVTLSAKALEKQTELTPEYEGFYKFIQGKNPDYELDQQMLRQARVHIYLSKKDQKGRTRYDRGQTTVFNLGSGDHIGYLLFSKLEIKPIKYTDSGKPSTEAEVLDEIISAHATKVPFLSKLLEYRKLDKLRSTYIEGILNRQIDGVLYTSMLQYGTTSGRYASRNPNLNNLPALKEEDDDSLSEIIIKYTNAIREGLVVEEHDKLIGSDFCLHPKTELLTKRGWIPVLDLNDEDIVWQVNKDTLEGSWIKPSRIIKRDYQGQMYFFNTKSSNLCVTKNHKMLYSNNNKTNTIEALSQDDVLKENSYFLTFDELTINYEPQKIISKERSYYEGKVGCVTVPEGFILVRSEGQTFITGNCSLEPHLAAVVSKDPGLVDIFVNDKDFYSAIGMKQFNKHDCTPYKDGSENSFARKHKSLRSLVKTYSLASLYGATAPRIAGVTGKSYQEAQQLLDGYFAAFPGVKKLITNTHVEAITKGYVKTELGRIRRLPEAKNLHKKYGYDKLLNYRWAKSKGLLKERGKLKNLLNNAVNFKIQGLAAHILNRAMIKMTLEFKKQGIDADILLPIHDEVLVRVRKDQVKKAEEIVKESMETCVDLSPIKLKSEPVIGNNYAECK